MFLVMRTAFERARAYADRAVTAVSGQGGHAATMRVARTLVSGFCLGADEAMAVLRDYNSRCLPPWTEAELVHKIRSALNTTSPHPPGWMLCGGMQISVPTKSEDAKISPVPWSEAALRRLANGLQVTPRWLAERSPIDPDSVDPAAFLGHVFEKDQKALVFTRQESQGQAMWPVESLPVRGSQGVWFLIQPVDGQFHANPRQGKRSRRSEEAVSEWRHMLLESDDAPRGLWLSAMCQLPLPIVSIASSGNRSLHVIIRMIARSKPEWDKARQKMLVPLSRLGCDAAAMTAVRLARLPGCWREDRNARQSLFYLNPAPQMIPLASL
jgi:hypothetical protein